MVPVWLLVPVLVLGVLVGAALGWWWRQRTLAAAQAPRRWAEEPAPTAVAAPPEHPAEGEVTEAAIAVEAPVAESAEKTAEPQPAPAATVTVEQPAPDRQQPRPDVQRPEPEPPRPEPAPEATIAPAIAPDVKPAPAAEPEPEPEAEAPQQAATPEAPQVEGERLDARMDDVLTELERRYRGRRVGPADAPDQPDPASRPRRPPRQR